jgi:predicted transcriptional regulator
MLSKNKMETVDKSKRLGITLSPMDTRKLDYIADKLEQSQTRAIRTAIDETFRLLGGKIEDLTTDDLSEES